MTGDLLAAGAGAAALLAVLLLGGRHQTALARSLLAAVPPLRRERREPIATAAIALVDGMEIVGAFVRRLARQAPDRPADRRTGLAVLLALAGLLVHPLVGAVLGAAPTVARIVRQRRHCRQAEITLVRDVPDLIDLFQVAAGGGLTVYQAVVAVAAVAADPFDSVLREVLRRVSVGERLSDALGVLAAIGEPVRPLVSALVSAERDGTALAGPLERVSDRARELRRRQAEEAARRVPVQLLFPLVLCVLPAFALLAVVPLLAGTLRSVSM